MAPYGSEAAKLNLQRGVKKMESRMTSAAQVRRGFQLGRPKKATGDEPLHPAVVWQRANGALSDLRGRMSSAKLNPADVQALIVYVQLPDMGNPNFLALEGKQGPDSTPGDHQRRAFDALSQPNTFAVGMLFRQLDRQGGTDGKGQVVTFPYQFMGLSERASEVLKTAGALFHAATQIQMGAKS